MLDELAFRHQEALESQSPESARAWQDFVAARQRLATLWVRGPAAGYTYWPELKEALVARKKAEKALAAASTGFRSSVAYQEVGLRDVLEALPPRSALVEYVRVPVRPPGPSSYTDHYIALILDDRSGARYADLGPAGEIDALVQGWLASLRDSYGAMGTEGSQNSLADGPTGRELRQRIWDPVVEQVPEADLVFVVLDGSLNQVHVPALPTSGGGYVIDEKAAVHVLSSGRDLIRIQDVSSQTTSGLLALGNPDFDLAEDNLAPDSAEMAPYRGPRARCGALRGIQWRSLPETEIEVQEIGSLYEDHGDVTLLLGAAATEDKLKREAPGVKYLHIATHGFFLQGDCPSADAVDRGIGLIVPESQAEEEAPGLSDGTLSALAFGENPLLLSGLVLAGANNTAAVEEGAEDGIVTAEEIAALDLRGLRIAALSACDTGLGTVATGEGVFGLRRALEIAGAQTVLMSLWSVPDEAAREWMTGFYERKLAGSSVQQATQATSMALLQRLRQEGKATHPYLWAGFVAAGDWR